MDIQALVELNSLWEPVKPYLARQISDLYGRKDGSIVEIGPFSGLLFDLVRINVGTSFLMALFPETVVGSLRKEAKRLGLQDKIAIRATDEKLSGIPGDSADLVIFRGAFFFPSIFKPDLTAIYRALKAGGVAFVGGGFGLHTPLDIIERIGKRSSDLNRELGRVRIGKEDLQAIVRSAHLEENVEIIEEGGLWIVMRKP